MHIRTRIYWILVPGKIEISILSTDREKGIYGPGHNSFTKSEDGTKDIMIFHARQYEEIVGNPLFDPNRHTMIMEIKWSDDGMPVLSFKSRFRIDCRRS